MTSKFEKKYGRYAIRNLSFYLIIAYVLGYVIELISPAMYNLLLFNPYLIFHGQIWRIFTWILVPPEGLSIFTIIMLFLYYSLGRELEHVWGTYRYNVYMFSGFIFTVGGSLILFGILMLLYYIGVLPDSFLYEMVGYGFTNVGDYIGSIMSLCVSTYYINMSIFLAYAVTYPEEQLMLYFIIPIKIKWFGFLYGAYIIFDVIQAFRYYSTVNAVVITVLIVASLLNFLIYWIFARHRGRYNPKQVKRRQEYKKSIKQAKPVNYGGGARHKCAVCGRTELDNPNLTFRYCSKCTGNKEYCEEHLFTHEHK